tara:strand:+ start:4066 stop:6138 length:2073 start_codon:yes stop_codon:yes gene_type:complete
MANTIRHKRGTSDPSASDFSATAELLVNTTDGGLFTKKDDGSVVEIGAGGGGSTTLSSDAQGNTIGGTNAGDSFSGTSAEKNTLFGYNAGTALETGDENTFYGYDAGKVCTYRRNTAIGYNAGIALVDGQLNSILGWKAAESLTTGTGNTIVGAYEAGNNITTGSNNIVLGQAYANSTGSNNIVIGNVSLMNSSDSENTVIGTGDMYCQSTTGSIVIGHDARHGQSGPGGDNCITLGYTNITHFSIPGINFELKDNGGAATNGQVLTADSNGYGYWADAAGGGGGGLSSDAQRNTVGGSNAGNSFTGTDATDNTLIGYDAGTDITTADYNSFYGSYAGENCTTGSSNCAYGFEAGEALTTGQKNVLIGHEAARASTVNTNCVAIGYQALRDNVDGTEVTWRGNVAIGTEAGRGSTAYNNTYVGFKAGQSPSDASGQVFVGYEAGVYNQGHTNVGIGWKALATYGQHSDGGSFSNAYNVGIGRMAGYGSNASGRYNVMLGFHTMSSRTSADSVVALGKEAGDSITTGSDNVLIGANAGFTGTNNLTTGSNNILIGHDAAASSATVSNEITLGDSNISSLRCQVQTISSLSDERDKTQIEELPVGLDFVSQLKPVKFKWKSREGITKDGTTESGFIAQQLQTAQKENDADYLGLVYDNDPERLEASYGKLIPVLCKAIQELKMEIETLKNNG